MDTCISKASPALQESTTNMSEFCPTTSEKPTSCWSHECAFSLRSKNRVEFNIMFIYAAVIGRTSLPRLYLARFKLDHLDGFVAISTNFGSIRDTLSISILP